MAKALKIAAIVVGVAAIVVTGGAAIGVLPATIAGISTATIGTVLTIAATALSVSAGLLAKPPKISGLGSQQLDWRADPTAGEPYVVGDAMVGTAIVHQASWGDKNKFLGIVGVLSLGAIFAYDGLYADGNKITFSSRNAVGYYHNFMYVSTQLGAQPETAALTMTAPDASQMPDWGAAYKTSGLATVGLVLVADVDNGKVYSGGTPKLTNRVRGVLAYDARADSTQAGGSGAQRALNETTYVYSENPWVHAETYALGRWQNGIRVIGPGLAPAQIDFASYMEAANIADANGWKISGLISSTDDKWNVLKAMAQAGGGVPMPTGAHLSCLINTPRVSIGTITEADVKGPISAPQMFTRRDRINGAIPRFRSAGHGWEVTPGNVVRNSAYLAADGGKEATREVEFALVADRGDGAGIKQAAQLAAYEVANSRERAPISVELGYVWAQHKLGDCLTLDLPSANLAAQKAIVIGREVNVSRNTVTLIFRTEDDAKHTWALAQTGNVNTPPATVQTPGVGDNPVSDWNTVINRPTELTDGRVAAGLMASGDLNRDLAITRMNSSNVLRYAGGQVFTGDLNASFGAAWGSNVVGRPTNLAGLGGGEALLNPTNGNELLDDSFDAAYWNLSVGAGHSVSRVARSGGGGFATGYAPYCWNWDVPSSTAAPSEISTAARQFPVEAGKVYHYGCWLQKNGAAPASSYVLIGVRWFDSVGAAIRTDSITVGASSITPSAAPAMFRASALAPANAATGCIVLAAENSTASVGFTFRFERPFVNKMEQSGLTYAGSGVTLADSRNLRPIVAAGAIYQFTGAISYATAAGAPATCSITVGAGALVMGSTSISYNAMSAVLTGTGGSAQPVTYLYVQASPYVPGAHTLLTTTDRNLVFANDNNVYIGQIPSFIYPTSGTGGGTGPPGQGCPWIGSFVHTARGWVLAVDVRGRDHHGDDCDRVWGRQRTAGGSHEYGWVEVESNDVMLGYCYVIEGINSGIRATVSDTTPIELRDGAFITVREIDGHAMEMENPARQWWEGCVIHEVGEMQVCKIRAHQCCFASGDVAGFGILLHNPKP